MFTCGGVRRRFTTRWLIRVAGQRTLGDVEDPNDYLLRHLVLHNGRTTDEHYRLFGTFDDAMQVARTLAELTTTGVWRQEIIHTVGRARWVRNSDTDWAALDEVAGSSR